MSTKRLIGLAPVLAVAALVAMPGVAQAAPRVFINGAPATTKHEPGFSFGKITLKNSEIKELTCENFAATTAWNEVKEGTERGFEETTGYGTWECKAALKCETTNENGAKKEATFASAEGPPSLAPTEKTKARRSGNTSLPWTGELIEKEKQNYVLTHNVKVWIVIPLDKSLGGPGEGNGCELIGGNELLFEDQSGATEKEIGDELAPKTVNGTKNGLFPSHGIFAGEKTEKDGAFETGRLVSKLFGPGFTSGELVSAGSTDFELVTAQ
jgi:hypothetical protein